MWQNNNIHKLTSTSLDSSQVWSHFSQPFTVQRVSGRLRWARALCIIITQGCGLGPEHFQGSYACHLLKTFWHLGQRRISWRREKRGVQRWAWRGQGWQGRAWWQGCQGLWSIQRPPLLVEIGVSNGISIRHILGQRLEGNDVEAQVLPVVCDAVWFLVLGKAIDVRKADWAEGASAGGQGSSTGGQGSSAAARGHGQGASWQTVACKERENTRMPFQIQPEPSMQTLKHWSKLHKQFYTYSVLWHGKMIWHFEV